MIKMRIKTYGAKKVVAGEKVNTKVKTVQIAEARRASIHTTKIIMPYARFDKVRCLNGQYTA